MLSFRTVENAPRQRAGLRAQRGSGASKRASSEWLFLAGILAIGAVLSGRAVSQNLQSDEQSSTIRGTVVNSVTHTPIARALVRSTDGRFAMLTDGEGHFEFALPKAATESGIMAGIGSVQNSLALTARKPGFLDNPRGRPNWVEARAGVETTIPLTPEALIVGRVTLSTGDSAVGIGLEIFFKDIQDGRPRWIQRGAVRTNSAGEFRYAELSPGSYKLFTNELLDNDPAVNVRGSQRYGFAPVYYPNAADFSSGGTIELAAGQTVQADFSVTHQPYYEVKIPVTNGESSGGLNVTVMVQGHRGPGYSLGYNAGTQKIEGLLPTGNYIVEAETYGQNSTSGSVNLKVAGAPVEGPAMTLVRNAVISVNVREEFTDAAATKTIGAWNDVRHHTISYRGPQAYLQVMAEPVDDFERGRTGTPRPPMGPDDNSLVIEDLPPGRYWVQVNSQVGYVAAVSAGATDLLHEPLMIAAGSNTPIEVKVRDDSAELDGSIGGLASAGAGEETDSGTGSSQAFVYCIPLPESAGFFKYKAISSDGKFQLQLAPGDYRVLVFSSRQPELPYRDPEAMRVYETKGQVVHLSAGQKTSVQLQVIAGSE